MRGSRGRVILLLAAVALAFADASVVALALPELYGEFDTTIVGVSWVLTTYALAVAVAAIPVAVWHRRLQPLHLVLAGTAVFAAASIVAGVAGGLGLLLGARAAQGVGAALLLAGSLPMLAALVPGTGQGRRWWAMAAAVGAAIGPALGGVLTEAFSWRAIFLVQAPIVAGALAVVTDRSTRAIRATPADRDDGRSRRPAQPGGAARSPPPTSGSRSCSRRSSRRCSSACSWRSRCGATARPSPPCWSARSRSA